MAENLASKIALGSVQWGMTYGVANASGRPDPIQLARMLRTAYDAGVRLIDTAYAYGEAESVIGQLPAAAQGFDIVTKTGPVPLDAGPDAAEHATLEFLRTSLSRLGRQSVHGVLVHNANALLSPYGERIWAALTRAKDLNLANNIGVSVYDPRQLEEIMTNFRPDIVQLPCNVYDRRFIRSGAIAAVKAVGAQVHARSAFLQGLLLMGAGQLPKYFEGIREHHGRFLAWCAQESVTPLQAALGFALEQSGADQIVVGTETIEQLEEILAAAGKAPLVEVPTSFEISTDEIVNPSLWKL